MLASWRAIRRTPTPGGVRERGHVRPRLLLEARAQRPEDARRREKTVDEHDDLVPRAHRGDHVRQVQRDERDLADERQALEPDELLQGARRTAPSATEVVESHRGANTSMIRASNATALALGCPPVTVNDRVQDREVYRLPFDVVDDDIVALGHASNIAFVRWIQEVAIAHSSAVGLSLDAYQRLGAVFVVVRHEIDYLRPGLRGDVVEARTWISSVMAAKCHRATELVRKSDGRAGSSLLEA